MTVADRNREEEKEEEVAIYSTSLCCRKYAIVLNNILVFLGVGLESLAVNPAMFIVGRSVAGVNAGK